jgi:hypothetical protein
MLPASEVFTPREIARAAGVSDRAVRAGIAAANLQPIGGTQFFSSADSLRLTRELRARRTVADRWPAPAPSFPCGRERLGQCTGVVFRHWSR